MSTFPGIYANAATGVFWDFSLRDDDNVVEATQQLRGIVSECGYVGPVTIRAYGDKRNHDVLSAGLIFTQFSAGEKFVKQTKMLEDIVSWAAENPEPSTLMLIMRDPSDDFNEVLELLKRQKNYNVIHVAPPPPTVVILVARP